MLAKGKQAAAVIPTRPVPAPSSRILKDSVPGAANLDSFPSSGEGRSRCRWCRNKGKRLARRYEASHVLCPRLSDVRDGS